MEFTAHNIALPDGSQTKPDLPLMQDRFVTRAALNTLDWTFPRQSRDGVSIVDLGCLEGGYAVEFARAGFNTLGLDARRANIDKCKHVARQLELPNLGFVCDDVRNLAKYGPFDGAFCCGLLYHLDEPGAFLELLARSTRRLLILHTHYSIEASTTGTFPLTDMTEHEGLAGRWYTEFPEDASAETMEASPWASYGNTRSF
jgi:SAM-dependent methyltransferase